MANQRIKLSPWIVIQMLFFHRRHPVSAAFNLLGLELVGSLVYAIIAILGFVISRVLAARRHPDLIAERARFMQHENTKSWENRLAPLVGFSGGLILLVCGLDAQFGWSPSFSLPVKIPGVGRCADRLHPGLVCLDRKSFFLGHSPHPD